MSINRLLSNGRSGARAKTNGYLFSHGTAGQKRPALRWGVGRRAKPLPFFSTVIPALGSTVITISRETGGGRGELYRLSNMHSNNSSAYNLQYNLKGPYYIILCMLSRVQRRSLDLYITTMIIIDRQTRLRSAAVPKVCQTGNKGSVGHQKIPMVPL